MLRYRWAIICLLCIKFIGVKAETPKDTLYSYQQLMQFLDDGLKNKDPWRLAEVHALFGDYHFYTADYENTIKSYKKSISLHKKSIDLREGLGDSLDLYQVQISLSNFYIFQNMYPEAERILKEAAQFYIRKAKPQQLTKTYIDLAKIYRLQEEYSKEIKYLNKAVEINRNLNDTISNIAINLAKGTSYLNIGENNKALGTAERAYALSRAINNINYQSRSLLILGNAYKEKQQIGFAIDYLKKSMELTTAEFPLQYRDVFKALSETYALSHQYDTAYLYLNKYAVLNDSLMNSKKITIASKFSQEYESERKDAIISELSEEWKSAESSADRNRRLLLSALVGFVVVLAGIYFIIRFFQKQIFTKELISRQNEEINRQKIIELENNMKIESMHAMIEGQEAERERVAKDLHDSLGGLLSTVKLQFDSLEKKLKGIDNISNYKNANRLLDTACQEVRDIARNMQPSALLNLGLVAAIKDLINRIDDPDSRHIDFQHYGLEEKLENTVALTVYRLVQELLNNSIKHSKASEILVQLTREDHELIIMVEDDGIGFDVDGVKKGMGTENIMSRVNYLKGDLSVHSEKGKGTTTMINVPI